MILTGDEVFGVVKKFKRTFGRYEASQVLDALIRCIEENERNKKIAQYAITGFDSAEGPSETVLASFYGGALAEVVRTTCGAQFTYYQRCTKGEGAPDRSCVNAECFHNSEYKESTDG